MSILAGRFSSPNSRLPAWVEPSRMCQGIRKLGQCELAGYTRWFLLCLCTVPLCSFESWMAARLRHVCAAAQVNLLSLCLNVSNMYQNMFSCRVAEPLLHFPFFIRYSSYSILCLDCTSLHFTSRNMLTVQYFNASLPIYSIPPPLSLSFMFPSSTYHVPIPCYRFVSLIFLNQ